MSGKRNVLKQADQFKVAKYIENNVERFAGRSIDSVRDEVAAHFKFDVTSTNIRSIATHIECEWWKSADEARDEIMKQLRVDVESLKEEVAALTRNASRAVATPDEPEPFVRTAML